MNGWSATVADVDYRASFVIPAHNEELRMRGLLATLTEDIDDARYAIFVVCNGCTDRTRLVAHRAVAALRRHHLRRLARLCEWRHLRLSSCGHSTKIKSALELLAATSTGPDMICLCWSRALMHMT